MEFPRRSEKYAISPTVIAACDVLRMWIHASGVDSTLDANGELSPNIRLWTKGMAYLSGWDIINFKQGHVVLRF